MRPETGVLYDLRKYTNKKKAYIGDCISIYSFQDGYILNKDGSIAVGFEINSFEEESKDGDDFTSLINDFSAACKRLPMGTVLQKLDIYHAKETHIPIPSDLPFFYRKTLEHHDQKSVLNHHSFIFFRFFTKELTPLNTFLNLGNILHTVSFDNLERDKPLIESVLQEFLSSLPAGLEMKRLDDQGHQKLLYQYVSLTFDRAPICFENGLTALEDSLLGNGYMKSVRMKGQSYDVFDWSKNNLGIQGVTSPFMWPTTHFANFPHIISQQIEIIHDQDFRKAKSRELTFSAQLSLGARGRELSAHVKESFMELEKELIEHNSQIVKLNYHVMVWDPNKDALQPRVDQLKGVFGKLGIAAEEEKENTLASFFANMPGCSGFLEGIPMPLETAVAHLNFVTPRKGDEEGILLSDRHGSPIFYNPFKYSLDNQHAFVFGPTGSGKSFFNGKMIKDRFYAGHTMIVIDSGGTYRNLFKAIGGRYIEYNPESPLALNPFLVKQQGGKYKAEADKIDFLVNFIAKIWKGDLQKNSLSEEEYAILSKSLNCYYKDLQEEEIPTLRGFCKWLPSFVANEKLIESLFKVENFLLVLEPFTEGIYSDHFNSLEDMKVEDTRLICFELEAVKANTKLYPLVVKVLFDYVLELVAKQPDQKKFIDIEEGWTMLDDSSKDYIEAFFRKGRKTNTAIRIITQNIDEIQNSPIAGAMKNNASTFILLYNDKESVRNDIAEFLGLNDFDREKYASLTRKNSYRGGFREVFIKEMDSSAVWRVETSLFEHAILTSRPDERNAINKLIQERGDIELAACQWVKQTLEKEVKYE